MKSGYFKDAIKDTLKILNLLHNITKSFLPITITKNILQASIPFVNIIYSYLILDGIIEKMEKESILYLIYWMIGLNLCFGLLTSMLSKYLNIKTSYINQAILSKIADKSLTLDYELLEKKECLLLLQKAKEGSTSHGDMSSFCNNIGGLISHIMTFIYSVILLVTLFQVVKIEENTYLLQIMNSPYIVLLLFLSFFLSIYINLHFIKQINEESYSYFEKNVDNNRKFFYFMELANNYQLGKDIRLYRMSDMIEEEMEIAHEPAVRDMRKVGKVFGTYIGLTEIVNQGCIFVTYAYVGIKAILGLISVGSILKYVSALVQFFSSITRLISTFTSMDLQRQYLSNLCMFLDLENKKYEGTLPIEKRDDNEYELEFKNVSFHYPNSEELILKNVSMNIKVGNKMAIVGRNGAGKTTFIKLLCRLYDPTEGEILLNGINIKKYDYKEYLKIFSVVFQDFKLFSFDIGQNVAASVDTHEDKIWEALTHAGVVNRVKAMDDGIHTNIYQNEENGVEISGGEAQKIAIARALYKDAPLVILDEPTSALDPVSEYEIYAKFDKLVTDKTSIYISHRMSSCRFCDRIVVFEDGQIVQVGDHETLIKEKSGLYHALWTAQAKYYVA